jgi:hypothetical protein
VILSIVVVLPVTLLAAAHSRLGDLYHGRAAAGHYEVCAPDLLRRPVRVLYYVQLLVHYGFNVAGDLERDLLVPVHVRDHCLPQPVMVLLDEGVGFYYKLELPLQGVQRLS